MKFFSAASILLLALPSAFSQRRGNGKRRKLNSIKSCKSDKKGGCVETVDFELLSDEEHPSTITFGGGPPFDMGGHDHYGPGPHDDYGPHKGALVHIMDEHGHGLTGWASPGHVTKWDDNGHALEWVASSDEPERKLAQGKPGTSCLISGVKHDSGKRLLTGGRVTMRYVKVDPHGSMMKADPHSPHWTAMSHLGEATYSLDDTAYAFSVKAAPEAGLYSLLIENMEWVASGHDGKLGHKGGHTEGHRGEYMGKGGWDNGGHDHYGPPPKMDLAGTIFMNRGVINNEWGSHYTVKCHIMEAGIDGGKYPAPVHPYTRALNEAYYEPIWVSVQKAICELDICTQGESPVEDDCIYTRYSGPFSMQFDVMAIGKGWQMMPTLPSYVGAVIGGTGIYRGATGTAVVKPSAGPLPTVHIAYIPSDLVHYDFGEIMDPIDWSPEIR